MAIPLRSRQMWWLMLGILSTLEQRAIDSYFINQILTLFLYHIEMQYNGTALNSTLNNRMEYFRCNKHELWCTMAKYALVRRTYFLIHTAHSIDGLLSEVDKWCYPLKTSDAIDFHSLKMIFLIDFWIPKLNPEVRCYFDLTIISQLVSHNFFNINFRESSFVEKKKWFAFPHNNIGRRILQPHLNMRPLFLTVANKKVRFIYFHSFSSNQLNTIRHSNS